MDQTSTPPPDDSTSSAALPPGKRRPTTGAAQDKRVAWGNQWGSIVSDLAAAKRDDQAPAA